MKIKKKILIIILVVCILLMILLTFLKINRSNSLEKGINDINISNITFSNFSYQYYIDGNYTNFEFLVKNNNNKSVKLNNYTVSIYDENNNLIDIYSFNYDYVFKSDWADVSEFQIDFEYKDNYSLKIELPELEFLK